MTQNNTHPSKGFDKYKYYIASVQSPESDVEFFEQVWQELRSRKKLILLREDFCGTFIVCCQWVKSKKYRKALGIDINKEPLDYGYKAHYAKLNNHQKKRVSTCHMSVLSTKTPSAQMIVANNFSIFSF